MNKGNIKSGHVLNIASLAYVILATMGLMLMEPGLNFLYVLATIGVPVVNGCIGLYIYFSDAKKKLGYIYLVLGVLGLVVYFMMNFVNVGMAFVSGLLTIVPAIMQIVGGMKFVKGIE